MPRTQVVSTLLALGIPALFAQSSSPTIRTSVRLVTVPTLVFSQEGKLITGLDATDFRVFDNGQQVSITLDTFSVPVSVVLAVQANTDVREYLSFIVRAGAVIESLMLGESGEAAVIAYRDDVAIVKPFEAGEVQSALRKISASGRDAHMLDAGWRGLMLLRQRPVARARFLIFIGQPMDSGSQITLPFLKEAADKDNVIIFAITLPELGKAFVSDNFALESVGRQEGKGFRASVNFGALIAALSRSSKAAEGVDPFSVLTAATGGTQVHIRNQREFEKAISAIGEELRSFYQLSFSPRSDEPGYHVIKVEVDTSFAALFSRPGYWMGPE